jgi:hypothetical protein
MAKQPQKTSIILGITVLILATLACGSIQVGVVTPSAEKTVVQVSDIQEQVEVLSEESSAQLEDETVPEAFVEEIPETPTTISVIAWLGHIASLPESSQYDDFVILSPQGTGEFGLTGATPEIEAEIRGLRDATGPSEYIHLWGNLSCNVEDYNGCQLVVDKLQYGATYSEGSADGWIGTIKSSTFNSGLSYVFELSGDYPMWYSIYASQDETLQAQIESLRDTGAVVNLSGKLLVGIPDVNGTRIEVSQLEVIEAGTSAQTALPVGIDDLTADWPVFINDRYDYQIKYPVEASINLFGPVSFSADEVPEGTTPEQYLDELLKTYTDRLCVQIEISLGTVYISAPPNQDKFYTPCGPTGVGAGEVINKIENVYIGGQLYQANGMEVRLQLSDGSGGLITGETLDMHYEWFSVTLENGTRIGYGAIPRQDASYEDYLMKTKDLLLQIISTYQALP